MNMKTDPTLDAPDWYSQVQAQFDAWAKDKTELHYAIMRALEGTGLKVKTITEEEVKRADVYAP